MALAYGDGEVELGTDWLYFSLSVPGWPPARRWWHSFDIIYLAFCFDRKRLPRRGRLCGETPDQEAVYFPVCCVSSICCQLESFSLTWASKQRYSITLILLWNSCDQHGRISDLMCTQYSRDVETGRRVKFSGRSARLRGLSQLQSGANSSHHPSTVGRNAGLLQVTKCRCLGG